MGGFLIVALAAPQAFGASGWAFGAGYLVVNVVHTVLFLRAGDTGIAQAMRGLAPLNLASALLVLVGGLLEGWPRYALWAAALALQIATPYLHRVEGHRVVAGHFVERHGLVVIVAIGESIVAIGVGASDLALGLSLVLVALLSLALSASLWWLYFSDESAVERSLARRDAGAAPGDGPRSGTATGTSVSCSASSPSRPA